MDLQSCLLPGDLFLSFWVGDQLRVVLGNRSGVLAVECSDPTGVRELVDAFERSVSRTDHFAALLAVDRRPRSWPAPATTAECFASLLEELGARVIPPRIRDLLAETPFSRLLLFPDGFLHALPLEHLVFPQSLWARPDVLPDGVIYSPSASAYVYASQRRRHKRLEHALVLVGDRNDPAMLREAERVRGDLPCQVAHVTTMEELQAHAERADLIYVVAHGDAPGPSAPGRGWALQLDDRSLSAEDFYLGRVRLARGALVVLSACSVGRVQSGPAHEIEGLVHGLFFAGAAAVIAARWPVLEQVSEPLLTGAVGLVVREQTGLAAALRRELREAAERPEVRAYMISDATLPFLLGAFALYGSGD